MVAPADRCGAAWAAVVAATGRPDAAQTGSGL
jgi:hypothetical protein